MEECLAMLDFSPRQVSELIAFLNRTEATQEEILWKELPLDVSRRLWNFYFDEQEIFYKKCFQIVREMKRAQFEELVGDLGMKLEARVLDYRKLFLKQK